MAGVVAALEANHVIGRTGEKVDNFAFSFVTPLGADNYHTGH
jgi:hypothetical protein